MKGFLFKLMALMAIISLIVMPVYADHSSDNDVLGADDEDESHITVDKSPESDDKFRFSLNANGGCIWYDYDAGTWKSYSGITKYELNANILIIKDSYSSGDETDWQTCKRFKIVSIKGNTMVCTVCLMDEGDTELTFTKR